MCSTHACMHVQIHIRMHTNINTHIQILLGNIPLFSTGILHRGQGLLMLAIVDKDISSCGSQIRLSKNCKMASECNNDPINIC